MIKEVIFVLFIGLCLTTLVNAENFGYNLLTRGSNLQSSINFSAIIIDTSAYVNCTGDQVFLGNGSCISSSVFGGGGTPHTIDTSAYVNCSGDEVFLGNGSCLTSSGFGGGGAGDNSSWNQSFAGSLFVNLTGDKMTGDLDMNSNQILNLAGLNLTQDINLNSTNWLVETPTLNNHTANKKYVDDATSSTAFDFFFNNESSNIAGHFNMTENDLERPESSLDSASLGTGTFTIFNWTSLVGQPEFNELRQGVYDVHIHLNVDGAGRKPVTITPKLYNISADGSTRNLLITFETSDELTSIGMEYNLHGVLTSPMMINNGERLNLELEADVGVTGADVIVTVAMEGTTDSHLTVETSTNAFEKIYIRRDGTNTLLGNWDVGGFNIFNIGNLNADSINITDQSNISKFNATYDAYATNVTINWTNTTFGLHDTRWSSVFNVSYDGSLNNASYLETNNDSYILKNGTTTNLTISGSAFIDLIFSSDSQVNITYSPNAKGYLVIGGEGNYVNTSAITHNITGGAVCGWIYSLSGAGNNVIASSISPSNTNRLDLQRADDGELQFRFRANGVNQNVGTTSVFEFDNTWISTCGVWNTTDTLIYLNGVLNNSAPYANALTTAEFYSTTIGVFANLLSGSATAYFDEVMMFNQTLTDADVLEYHNAGRDNTTYTSNKLLFWHSYNSDFTDSIGENDGVAVGNPFVFKEVIMGYNTDDFKVRDLIVRNIFGSGFMIENGDADFDGDVGVGDDITITGNNINLQSSSSSIIRQTQSNIDILFSATDGATVQTLVTIDASDDTQWIFESAAKQPLAEAGIRIGVDSSSREIDDSAVGSISSTLYIGDESIDTSIPSDRRTKQNIVNTTVALNDLMRLRVVDYEYNSSVYDKAGSYTGFVAQEVEEIFPNAIKNFTMVTKESEPILKNNTLCNGEGLNAICKPSYEVINMTEEETIDYITIDNDRLVPMIVKWLQELREENLELKARIEALEKPAPQL